MQCKIRAILARINEIQCSENACEESPLPDSQFMLAGLVFAGAGFRRMCSKNARRRDL
jgi:hypothetical protein